MVRGKRRVFYGWWILLAATIGLVVSPGPVAFYSIGVLMQPLSLQYGWTTSQVSLSATLLTGGIILGTPVIGLLVDRVGPRKVLIPSMIAFGVSLLTLSFAEGLWTFYFLYFCLGMICAGANSLAYMQLLSNWFSRRRGLAIGIASSGMGLGFAIIPPYTQFLLEHGSIALAYSGLGLLVLVLGVPVVSLIVRDTPGEGDPGADRADTDEAPTGLTPELGVEFRQALRMHQFWTIMAIFVLGSGAMYAIALHLVSIVRSVEPDSDSAIRVASLVGITMMLGRVLAGYIYDKAPARWVTAGIFLGPAIGALCLGLGLPGPWIVLAAILIGLSSGAESDALGILVGKYFGLIAYGRIYGQVFCASLVGASLFPYLLGLGVEHFGAYREVLYICAIMFGTSAVMSVCLAAGSPPDPARDVNLT